MNPSLTAAWLAEVVLISYRATRQGANEGTEEVPLPLPSQYASTFIIYGVLGLLPAQGAGFASLVGWGFVVATLLNLWNPIAPGNSGLPSPTVAKTGSTTAAGTTANMRG